MAISPFRPDARGMTAAVPQMASVYNDLKQGTPFKAGGGPGIDAWRSPAIAQSAAGLGMPTGGPALDLRSLDGATQAPNPGAGMGPWGGGAPRVAGTPIADVRNAAAGRATSQSPWASYGGAFGGVNVNDLYRRNAPNTAGPNGMMGPAPNLDFNQMARSQVGGQGARLAASKPWEGVFASQWRTANGDDLVSLANATKRKLPDGSHGGKLFGQAPSGPMEDWRQPFNPETGVSLGYGPGRGSLGERDPNSEWARMSDEALQDWLNDELPGGGFVNDDPAKRRAAEYELRYRQGGSKRKKK